MDQRDFFVRSLARFDLDQIIPDRRFTQDLDNGGQAVFAFGMPGRGLVF